MENGYIWVKLDIPVSPVPRFRSFFSTSTAAFRAVMSGYSPYLMRTPNYIRTGLITNTNEGL